MTGRKAAIASAALRHPLFFVCLSLGAAGLGLPAPALAAGPADDAAPPAPNDQPMEVITVVGERLSAPRSAVEPSVGASTYSLSNSAIQGQPGGDNASLSQVVLQAPGVAQDSFGQIHVRNEHGNVEYRVDGIVLPEGASFFGQSLPTRIASSVNLITGALPAQYGLQTAGVIEIDTKSGTFQPGGAAGIYGGSHGWLQPSTEYAGSVGHFNYYVSGDYLQNGIGVDNPTPSYNAIHDQTQQGHGFAYLDDAVDATTKVSAILGVYRGQFQIPNNPGQTPSFTVNGVSSFDSALLNESQREISDYGVLSYSKAEQGWHFQVSGFSRYSSLTFDPDQLGDLIFNGLAQSAYRRSLSTGVQADSAYDVGTNHTLRAGLLVTAERAVSATTSTVLPGGIGADGTVFQTSDVPESLSSGTAITGWTYSLYAQDEWKLTPTVTVNYGGRFDVVNALTNESQISPRLNSVWKATTTTTVHAGYANYFTPPPLEFVATQNISQFVGTTAQPAVTQNSPVKAERSHYFDVGIDQKILTGLTAGIDAYYKYSRNLIDEGQFGAPIILTPFNYHIGQNHGVELSVNYDNDGFALYANLAIGEQKAEDISSAQFNFTPDELAYIANHTINTDHSQSITGSGGLSYLWKGTRYSVDVITGTGLRTGFANISALPSYEQVNLGISHRFEAAPGGPVELRADLVNALDQIYQIRSGTGVGVGAPQFGPRRGVFVGLRKEF